METIYYKPCDKSSGYHLEAVTEDDFGNVLQTRRVCFPLYECKDNNKLFFLQYNDKMELLYDVCEYLNYYIDGSSENTRRFKARVLRRYLCFMELLGFPYNDLSDQYVIDRVDSFFRGEDYRSEQNEDRRQHESVNNYESVIRDFCRFINPDFNGFDAKNRSDKGLLTKDGKRFSKRYRSSLVLNPHANDNIKPFLYPDEFASLVRLATERDDVQAVMIFHLMFFYGLRIGECLGLTEEDFMMRRRNDAPSPLILLRNRLSDTSDQFAKELFHPSKESDYEMKYYPAARMILSMDFYEKLTMFVESVGRKYEAKGVRSRAEADCISKEFREGHRSNHYIFLNKYGKPLLQQAWNKRLRDYFVAAGIQLDIGLKRDNLNHRFRHGCAMYYLHFAEHKMPINALQHFMRHKNVETTNQYLKMTYDQEFVLHEQFQDNLVKEIPSLFD